MTELEFISTNPTNYGRGNANLLISSSVSGSEDVPLSPYTIQGMTIPFSSKDGTSVFSTLKESDKVKFEFEGSLVTVEVISRQKKDGYFFYRLKPTVVTQLPPLNIEGDFEFTDSEFIFLPFFETDFFNNDFNPLTNTTNESKPNSIVQVVDRLSSQILPTNLTAILSSSAEPAQIQDCSYTKAGLLNSRYNGTKTTSAGSIPREYNKFKLSEKIKSGSIPGNSPAISLVKFKASLHPLDSDVETVKAIQLSDRKIVDVFFDSVLSGSHPTKVFQSFPFSSSFVFQEDNGSLVKIANQKIYSTDKNEVYTSNEFGGITLVS